MYSIDAILICLSYSVIGRRILRGDSQKPSSGVLSTAEKARSQKRSDTESHLDSYIACATSFLTAALPAAFKAPILGRNLLCSAVASRSGIAAASAKPALGQLLDPIALEFGVECSECLSVSDVVSGGRGLVATGDIARGSLLASIPISSCLTVPFAEEDGEAKLAYALLAAVNTSARWRKYADSVLPAQTHAAWLWSDDELEMLQFSEAQECAAALQESGTKLAFDSKHEIDSSEWQWALSIVYSRSVFLKIIDDGKDDDIKSMRALVPILDLANHMPLSTAEYAEIFDVGVQSVEASPQVWAVIRGAQGEARAALHAFRDFKPGEEVLLPYGVDYSNAYLLAQYGFVLLDNTADFHSLFMDKHTMMRCFMEAFGLSERQARHRMQIMENLYECDALPAVCPGGVDASFHLLGCVRVASASDDELAEFEQGYIPPSTPSSQLVVLRFCAQQAEARLTQCPSTLQEDQQHLRAVIEKDVYEVGDKHVRLRLALEYRISVKQMLQDFLNQCKEALQAAAWLSDMEA